ncbi:MAG: glycosyltransferase [Sedimentisphaerales bacterium]|nr:glycosyltransferase [Sedimentisphaerales bacterium]
MKQAGHQADILATDGRRGPDYDRARRDGWPVEAICAGERWLRRRLEITLDRLSMYDVVINNHSTETRLVLPALPAHIIRLSVIRSTNDPVISEGKAHSPYLDALVGISPEVHRLLQLAKVTCRTEMIANAVMVPPSVAPVLQNPLGLAYLGRLTDVDKNIMILPEIARACKKRGIKFTLDVAGDGRDRQTLEEKIRVLEVSDCVRLHGAISRDAVGDFLNKRQFGLFPSNYEGFGLTLVEAMASGCVPIASDIPSYRWILGDDADTLLATVKDAQAYADRIVALAADSKCYRQIQERLQRRQKQKFSPEATVNGYLRLIEELRKTHDPSRFLPVSLGKLQLSAYHQRRCSRAWWLLQKVKGRFSTSVHYEG